MNLLRAERETLDSYIPGLDKYLSESPLLELERPGSGALARFRELGGPALLVPAEYEGKGARPAAPRPLVITMPCSRGRSMRGSRPSGPSSA